MTGSRNFRNFWISPEINSVTLNLLRNVNKYPAVNRFLAEGNHRFIGAMMECSQYNICLGVWINLFFEDSKDFRRHYFIVTYRWSGIHNIMSAQEFVWITLFIEKDQLVRFW